MQRLKTLFSRRLIRQFGMGHVAQRVRQSMAKAHPPPLACRGYLVPLEKLTLLGMATCRLAWGARKKLLALALYPVGLEALDQVTRRAIMFQTPGLGPDAFMEWGVVDTLQ